MAKIGEGDQRWIVKERDDGKNCNNWHWSETNLTAWSKERLTEMLGALVAWEDGKLGWCKVTSLVTMSGDVTVQSRKQKKFPLYELEITLEWKGELWDENGKAMTEAKGKIKIPDLSEETYDDLEMSVTCDEESNAKRTLKEHMRKAGAVKIREACQAWRKELYDNVNAGGTATMKAKAPAAERFNSQYVTTSVAPKKTSLVKVEYKFNPRPQVMYDTLLDSGRLKAATASDATMSKEVGGQFSLFSGSVTGDVVALQPFDAEAKPEPFALITWRWRFSTWQPGHFSTVKLKLIEGKDESTKLELEQSGVPEEEMERMEKGWKSLLFDRLNGMLGGSVAR